MIKKYPNRRLYDTALGEYITTYDVLQRIEAGTIPRVIENDTKIDVTVQVYATILSDLAKRGQVDGDELLALIRSSAARESLIVTMAVA